MTALDVGLCQYALAGAGSVGALTDRAGELLDRAGPADVFVLPELFAVDATVPGDDELAVLSDAEFDDLVSWTGEQARRRGAVVVAGSALVRTGDGEDRSEDAVRNRCPVATPDGEVRTYDKRRPIPSEREAGIEPGETAPPLVEHGGTTVGVLVCYDVEFPAMVRAAVDRGAELLVVPSWTSSEAGFQRVRRCCAARAVENQASVAQVSLVGDHPVADVGGGTGRSALFGPCDDVVGPHGTRLSLARDEHAAGRARVDVDALRRSREEASVRPYTDAAELSQSTDS